jgi:hypothetical protein
MTVSIQIMTLWDLTPCSVVLKQSTLGKHLINFCMIGFFEINYFQITISLFFAGELVLFLVEGVWLRPSLKPAA